MISSLNPLLGAPNPMNLPDAIAYCTCYQKKKLNKEDIWASFKGFFFQLMLPCP